MTHVTLVEPTSRIFKPRREWSIMYVDCITAEARQWLEEFVGPFDPAPGDLPVTYPHPEPKPSHWDIVGLRAIDPNASFRTDVSAIRMNTNAAAAVMFKLVWG